MVGGFRTEVVLLIGLYLFYTVISKWREARREMGQGLGQGRGQGRGQGGVGRQGLGGGGVR